MAGTLLRSLAPVIGTHKVLPQSIFCVGGLAPDPLRFVVALDKPKHTCCIKKGDETFVLSTLAQAQQILEDPVRLANEERPVGISLYSKYSSLIPLNMVKHVYYLPASYGRLPNFVNLVEDGIPFHYTLNPSDPMTEINIMRKEYEKISVVTPAEHSRSHEEYVKFLVDLPVDSITPWRKVPLYDSDEAKADRAFAKEYGEVFKPSKACLRVLFGHIMSSVPSDIFPIIEMCRDKALALFDVYENIMEDTEKDSIGLEITRLFDLARNAAITFSLFSSPQPAPRSYSSASPHTYSPIFHKTPMGVHMYSTYIRERDPLTLLSPDAVQEFRAFFLNLWHEQGTDEEKAVDLADEVYRLSFFIQKIDKCGAFGKTPCPREGGWGW